MVKYLGPLDALVFTVLLFALSAILVLIVSLFFKIVFNSIYRGKAKKMVNRFGRVCKADIQISRECFEHQIKSGSPFPGQTAYYLQYTTERKLVVFYSVEYVPPGEVKPLINYYMCRDLEMLSGRLRVPALITLRDASPRFDSLDHNIRWIRKEII